MSIENYDVKLEALKVLVREAAQESRSLYPNPWRDPKAPEFDPTGVQTYHVDALSGVLQTTDALYVLDSFLNGDLT